MNYFEFIKQELGKMYNKRTLYRMKQFYETFKNEKVSTVWSQLSRTHYRTLLSIKNFNEIKYYINASIQNNLLVRELRNRIKPNEYQRLDNKKINIDKQTNV